MAVLRHTIEIPRSATWPSVHPWVVVSPRDGSGSPRAEALMTACAAAQEAPGPRLSLAGLAGEWAGRPGRVTHGFVAVEPGAGGDAEWVGLVLVVESESAGRRRFSLAWLLVHPDFRRRGVATALVCHALESIRARGGTRASVESLSGWPAAAAFWDSLTSRW